MTWFAPIVLLVGLSAMVFAARTAWMDMNVVRWFAGGPLDGTAMSLPRGCQGVTRIVQGVKEYSYTRVGSVFVYDDQIISSTAKNAVDVSEW